MTTRTTHVHTQKVETKSPQVHEDTHTEQSLSSETKKDSQEPLPKRGPKPQRKNNKKDQVAPAQA